MGSKTHSDEELIADINITPFVDIILVVLIIFMVTASTIANQSIQINLPDASSGEATETVSLGVTLLDSGKMLLDGEPTTGEALATALASYTDKGSNATTKCAPDVGKEYPLGDGCANSEDAESPDDQTLLNLQADVRR